jgi:serine/threonine protein kinase
MVERIGERVAGKYELKRKLGSGAMGAVYECVHVELGKRLAIKLIHRDHADSPDAVARFRREARAASAIESDHIVQVYDVGEDDESGLFMVQELLEGEDLEARIGRERWIDIRSSAMIGWQVARGLARAHAVGVVHRDLKPANIFLMRRDDGSLLAKILDFGISKISGLTNPTSEREPTITARGTTLGTPQYMAPEQCAGKKDLDGRADVWAVCALMYEMLAGEPAVTTQTGGNLATLMWIVNNDIPPLWPRAPWVPLALARVIDAGMLRDRERRIPDAATLADRIAQAYPEATLRTSFVTVDHPTDISELAFDEAPATVADPNAPTLSPPPAPSFDKLESGEQPVGPERKSRNAS